MIVWVMIALMIAVTFAERYVMLELANRVTLPMWLLRSLRFVPAALLTAIAVPSLIIRGGSVDLSPLNARLLAGIVAAFVAWRTRNVIYTIGAGMLIIWVVTLLQASQS